MGFYGSIAWRNLWRHKRRSLITATAMAVGVAVVMATLTMSDGMYTDMFEILVEQRLGHVQVHHPDYPGRGQLHDSLQSRAALLAEIDALDGTVAASPVLQVVALVGGKNLSTGGRLVGVDPARDRMVSPTHRRIVDGDYLSNAANKEILLGHRLAQEIEVDLGDEVVVLTQAADGSTGNDLFIVVGLVRTGDPSIDNGGGFVHIADAEELTALFDQAHGITTLTDHPDKVDAFAARVRAAVAKDEVQVQTWWEASPTAAKLMNMRNGTAFFTLGLTFFVAAFGVINTMLMSVYERTRELGILRALGMDPSNLVRLIVLESLFLAAVASTAGVALGAVADWYLVTQGLDFSGAMPDGMAYQGVILDPVWMGEVRPSRIVLVVSSVFVISVLASLWPAWRAARLHPATALRSE
jgi:ABC-type lipoprotein release transport system permease subunit